MVAICCWVLWLRGFCGFASLGCFGDLWVLLYFGGFYGGLVYFARFANFGGFVLCAFRFTFVVFVNFGLFCPCFCVFASYWFAVVGLVSWALCEFYLWLILVCVSWLCLL